MSVSRETPGATELFGEDLTAVNQYLDLLASAGIERGLIGPREVPRLWDRHVLNCAAVMPRVPRGADVADVGSGAGLPGLVWAIGRPDLALTLIEPLQRRATFLTEVVEQLGLINVTVERDRAESVKKRFDVVTARAVARLDKLAGWCLPLVRPGGVLLALKGESAADEVAMWTEAMRSVGATDIVVTFHGEPWTKTTVVEVNR